MYCIDVDAYAGLYEQYQASLLLGLLFVLFVVLVFILIKKRPKAGIPMTGKQRRIWLRRYGADRFVHIIEDDLHKGLIQKDDAQYLYRTFGRVANIPDLLNKIIKEPESISDFPKPNIPGDKPLQKIKPAIQRALGVFIVRRNSRS